MVQIARIGLDLFDSNILYLSGTNQWLNEGLSMYINYKIRGNLNPEIPLYTFSDYAFYAFNLLLQKSGLSIEPFLRAAIIPPTDNNDPMIDLYNLMNIGPYVISQIGNVLAQKEGGLNPYENRVQELENVFSRFFN